MEPHAPHVSTPAAWGRWARLWRKNHVTDQVDRLAVIEHVHEGGVLAPRYGFMIVMSCGIATLGLLQNSVAVIIGAMLISPLMGPIIQLGMALATFELRSVRDALRTLAVGVALALGIAVLIVWFSPLKEATSEILGRTRPTFFDLLVAVLSGLAGAYATITRKGETIVGVAIATALMPPLAVVGYGIAVANWNIAGGAAFLFMTNLLAIALSVTIVARWYGFAGADTPKQSAWQALLIVATFVLLSVPLGLALKRIALQSRTELAVRATLDAAATQAGGRLSALRVESANDSIAVDAVMMLPRHVSGLETRLQAELSMRTARVVALRVREVLTADDESFARQQGTLAELRNSVAALQDAETMRSAQQRKRLEQQAGIQASLLPYLGKLERSANGARWELWLAAGALPLARAHRMETEINTRRPGGGMPIDVFPPLQALPEIALYEAEAGDAAAASSEALATQAWALQRWRAASVDATLVTASDVLAREWEARLSAALTARGLSLANLQRKRKGDPHLQLQVAATP